MYNSVFISEIFFYRFKAADAFVGYQKDTAASMILHASQLIEDGLVSIETSDDEYDPTIEEKVTDILHFLKLIKFTLTTFSDFNGIS